MTLLAAAGRLLVGATLAWCVGVAVAAPEVPRACALAGMALFAATLWRPAAGLLALAALAPAGALLAPAPVRAAELLAWAVLAGWLLRVWRPLMPQGPRTVTTPALVFGLAVTGSWLALSTSGGAGTPVSALPELLLRSVPSNHLVFSSPEPETWTLLQSLGGLGLLLASVAAAREQAHLARMVAWTLAGSTALLAAATLASVVAEWSGVGYGGWFLLRYLNGERFSYHLADLNAAGSLYVITALTSAAAVMAPGRRGPWILALLVIIPALWLTGSRSSFLALAAGVPVLALAQYRRPLARGRLLLAASVLGAVLATAIAAMDWQPDVPGSAGRAANLRSQFLETTGRMFASAPLHGVGVGRYFDRSPEFMPAELRAIYGNENAHNYFAQQFAELGMVGGLLFLWLAVALVRAAWAAVRAPAASPVEVGLFAGAAAYLLTCITGHPLLVAEAALPFWIAAGALAGAAPALQGEGRIYPALAGLGGLGIAAGIAAGFLSYAAVDTPPPERGFHGIEAAPDGTPFRWMTRHGVTYVPSDGPGFLRLRIHAPGAAMSRPLVVDTVIAGNLADRRELPPGEWLTYDVPVRATSSAPFRRVDLRTNQVWNQEVPLGRRQARRPIAVMVGELRWIPLDEVR